MADTRRQSGLWAANPSTGTYEQQAQPYQYYQPPSRTSSDKKQRQSYSERAGDSADAETYRPSQPSGVQRTESRKVREAGTEQGQYGGSKIRNEARPLRLDPNAVPQNLRNKPRSPDLVSPAVQGQRSQRQASTSSHAAELLRRGSVPDRSPLQKLEMEFSSKNEKRARIEEAERRISVKGGKGAGRVVSDSAATARRPNEGVRRDEKPVRASAEVEREREWESYHGSRKFQRATDALKRGAEPDSQQRDKTVATRPANDDSTPTGNDKLGRSGSKYRHRARDAGFAGAAAAMAGAGGTAEMSAADRGRIAYERSRSNRAPNAEQAMSPLATVRSGDNTANAGLDRTQSKRLQKRDKPADVEWYDQSSGAPQQRQVYQQNRGRDNEERETGRDARENLQGEHVGVVSGPKKAGKYQEEDPIPPTSVATAKGVPVPYQIPPQTAAGQRAREQVGFGAGQVQEPMQEKHHHGLGGVFHHHDAPRAYQADANELEEWRNAGVARMRVEDLEDGSEVQASNSGTIDPNSPWWEREKSQGRRPTSSSGTTRTAGPQQTDGPYEEDAKYFSPPLYLKSGPLLRYTGIRRESAAPSRFEAHSSTTKEIWRGSIMIVTDDRQSDYSTVPTLRLFAQGMDLHTPPPQHLLTSGQELPPEYEDPVAGQVKLSRTGRPLYVRHVHEIDGEIDLSREENPQGLFAATRTPMLGPQSSMGGDGRESRHITFQDKSRVKPNRAEKEGRYREVRAHRLHVQNSYTFWRFNVEIELGTRQHRIAYRINRGPAVGFWVPARGETMNIMFHSCNGFSLAVDPDLFSGPDPLWRDVLNRHQQRPFHVMLGGGDQIYNDAVMRDTELFREWLGIKNPEHKHSAPFTIEMQAELEAFYLERYCVWFSQGLFGMANAQIPMVNLWDDHDIIDGFGSYPHKFMAAPVFAGVGAVAWKFYMLFQHQSVGAETQREEPSWLLGASPGPYINQLSRSVYLSLGAKVGFLGLDCRTERMRDEILSQDTYDLVFNRLRHELRQGGEAIRHLIVLLGVPIAYPRLNFLENILTSRMMDPIKALGRTGVLGGFVNKFDGGVEILDDLDDHWTAKHHKSERNWFISELQEIAREFEVRITILGGDVHLGAVGQFYSGKQAGLRKDRDWRYMPNIISSAIVNTPPPGMMADVLNKRNRVHKLEKEGWTEESMIPLFECDVDGSKRNNRCLLPRRNFCVIREFVPGHTPPESRADGGEGGDGGGQGLTSPRMFPPGSMKRTMSLTSGPGRLIRRLSGSSRSQKGPYGVQEQGDESVARPSMQRSSSLGGTGRDSYFPSNSAAEGEASANQRPINRFLRRPTGLNIKEARKAAARGGGAEEGDDEVGMIDLEGGLDISLCMEVDQRNPGGETVGYRLLVPALWCEDQGEERGVQYQQDPAQGDVYGGGEVIGEGEEQRAVEKPKREGLFRRLTGRGKRGRRIGEDGRSRTPSLSPPPSRGGAPMMFAQAQQQQVPTRQSMQRDGYDGARAPLSNEAQAYHNGDNFTSPPANSAWPIRQQTGQGGNRNGNGNEGTYLDYSPQAVSQPRQPASSTQRQYQHPAPTRKAAPDLPAPTNQKGLGARAWANNDYDDDYTEDSLTPSDEYPNSNARNPGPGAGTAAQRPSQPRRASKAERFLGIGDEDGPWGRGGGGANSGGGRQEEYEDFGEGEGELGEGERRGKGRGWKIWK
ncbi:hypothetical protein LTR62_003704 [Meristemomyces frigidus]|uniref:PhoD-like phosphatase domain-containing protein n=1 Tax=Meristemomyces frigidus TaxID=1508187 RepID=A0AAN7TJW9_9PEZI|nr:hypothetical protein LTR62_003704 [Meristemomyces frigidus]